MHVRAAVDFAFDNLGKQEVKNIAQPVQAYRVWDGSAVLLPLLRRRTFTLANQRRSTSMEAPPGGYEHVRTFSKCGDGAIMAINSND
jgi:hypothetical protein